MLLEELRREVALTARRLPTERLVVGTSGNVSAWDPHSGHLAITPSGVPYEELQADDIVLLDLEGNQIEGRWLPSSEHRMHRYVYQRDPRQRAVVHTHSLFATAFSACGREIPAIHYAIANIGTSIRVAPYATYGTHELAQGALDTMGDDSAVLLQNHGVLAVGTSLAKAFGVAQTVEFLAELYLRTLQIGAPIVVADDEIARVREKFRTYGQPIATRNTPTSIPARRRATARSAKPRGGGVTEV